MSSRLRTAGTREDSVRSRGLTLFIRQVPAVVVAGAILEFAIIPNLRRDIRVEGTLTLLGLQHPEEADQRPRI